jgi:hypothetical protein
MMTTGILKSSSTVYEFDLPSMKKLIAADLGVRLEQVSVEYVIQEVGGDPMDRYPGRSAVTQVRVTVEGQPPAPKTYSFMDR